MVEIPNPCPPLCVCGIRGCEFAAWHERAFLVPLRPKRHRLGRKNAAGRRSGRRT